MAKRCGKIITIVNHRITRSNTWHPCFTSSLTILIVLILLQIMLPIHASAAYSSVSVKDFYIGAPEAGIRIEHIVKPDYKSETLQPYSIVFSRYRVSEGVESRQELARHTFNPAVSYNAEFRILDFVDGTAGELEKGVEYRYHIRLIAPYISSQGVPGTYERTVEKYFLGRYVHGNVFRDTVLTGNAYASAPLTVENGVTLILDSGFTLNISDTLDWHLNGKLVAKGAKFITDENNTRSVSLALAFDQYSTGEIIFEENTLTGSENSKLYLNISSYGKKTPIIISGNLFLMGGCSLNHRSSGDVTIENNNSISFSLITPEGESNGKIKIRNNEDVSDIYLLDLTGYESVTLENNLFRDGKNIQVINSHLEAEPGLSIVNNKNVSHICLDDVFDAEIRGNEITSTGCGIPYAGITLKKGLRNVISENQLLGSDEWRPDYFAGISIGYQGLNDEIFGAEVAYNHITDNHIGMGEGFGMGIAIGSAENNIISGNTIKLCRTILHLGPFTHTQNEIFGSSYPLNNTITNNKFVKDTKVPSTARMVRIDESSTSSSCINTWNSAKQSGINVVGGQFLGGNYWSDYTGSDQDGDLIGDTPYTIDGLNKDDLPLIMPVSLSLSPGKTNPTNPFEFYGIEGEYDYTSGKKNVVASHLILTANELEDWNVTRLTFHTSGTGNEKEDISEARLFLDSTEGTLLGTGTFNEDNGDILFNVNVPVQKGKSVSMILVYDFNPERAFPCNDYRTKIDMGDIEASPSQSGTGKLLPVPPEGAVHGIVSIKRGDIIKADGDSQYGEAEDPAKNQQLAKPLKARIKWQHPATIDKVIFEITSPPDYEAFLGGTTGSLKSSITPNAEGYAEETMTLGTKKGLKNPYMVQVTASQKGAACFSSFAPPVFKAWGIGLDIKTTSQYDDPENGDVRFGTFISSITAQNRFTLTIDMTPGYAEVDKVTFKMGGQVVQGSMVTKDKVYEAIFDMSAVQAPGKLEVIIEMTKDGKKIEQQKEYEIRSLELPSWYSTLTDISESLTKEFVEDDTGSYVFSFSYPTNFIWSEYVPGSVGMLGGLGNDIDIAFSAAATYRVDETSSFEATLLGNPTILGTEIEMEGSLSGDFDRNFSFLRGSGNINSSISFDLPTVGYSITFPVCYVPVTAAVDLGGSVEIFVNGSAVLNRQLEFEEITVAPGTTLTGVLTISLEAVFGLARIAAAGSPYLTMEIEMKYTSAGGTVTTWRGEVAVPISVTGSLFWGFSSAELYSTTLGPWTFGSGASPQAYRPLNNVEGVQAPRFMSGSGLAADGTGRKISVWIEDTQPLSESPNPDVFFRYDEGAGWSDAGPLIGAASPNEEWEMDPAVVFMSNNTALAAWTANKGEKTLNNLNDIFAAQDIAYSVWNGTAWSAPARIIDDNEADGVVSLSYDPVSNRVFAAWVHNSDSDKVAINRTSWKIMYAFYDALTGEWSESQDIPGTAGGTSDQMPATAHDGNGNLILVWVRDDDGQYFTENPKNGGDEPQIINGTTIASQDNPDSRIMWSKWTGGTWSAPSALAEGNMATRLSPSVALAPDGKLLAVWVEKEPNGNRRIKYSVWFQGTWYSAQTIATGAQQLEDPRVVIDSNGKVTVIWRGYAGGKSALFSSTGTMGTYISWSEARQITSDDTIQWQPVIAAGKDNRILTGWSGYDSATGSESSGTGFSGGINVTDLNPGSALLTGVYEYQVNDKDSDGIYEALTVSVGVNVVRAGTYKLMADLYSDTKYIGQAALTENITEPGERIFTLIFPGGIISNRGIDGPYSLKNVVIIDMNESQVKTAFSASPAFTTEAYESGSFIPGPLKFDRESYQGIYDRAVITVTEPLANLNAGVKDTLTIKVYNTKNIKGLEITLIETDVNAGVFSRSLGFSTKANNLERPDILVADHDTIQVVYEDIQDYRWTENVVWSCSSAGIGDLNSDGEIDLKDAILVMGLISGDPIPDDVVINPVGMMDEKGRITMREVIFILQKISETNE